MLKKYKNFFLNNGRSTLFEQEMSLKLKVSSTKEERQIVPYPCFPLVRYWRSLTKWMTNGSINSLRSLGEEWRRCFTSLVLTKVFIRRAEKVSLFAVFLMITIRRAMAEPVAICSLDERGYFQGKLPRDYSESISYSYSLGCFAQVLIKEQYNKLISLVLLVYTYSKLN